MTKTEELLDLIPNKREEIIQRIMNLSDDQFERLIDLYSQQETGSSPICPDQHRTSA